MNLDAFFPTVIGSSTNPNHSNIEQKLVQYCIDVSQDIKPGGQGWLSNKTYNTSNGKFEIFHDEQFCDLNSWVKSQIVEYCDQLSIHSDKLENNGSWFNIYRKYDFQENHVHPSSAISAIYILSCPQDGARVFFNSPISNMYYVKKTPNTQAMVDQIHCPSTPGNLIIFPSYLIHAVERHESDALRISLSYNFRQS